jgi:hypothetical protein
MKSAAYLGSEAHFIGPETFFLSVMAGLEYNQVFTDPLISSPTGQLPLDAFF